MNYEYVTNEILIKRTAFEVMLLSIAEKDQIEAMQRRVAILHASNNLNILRNVLLALEASYSEQPQSFFNISF